MKVLFTVLMVLTSLIMIASGLGFLGAVICLLAPKSSDVNMTIVWLALVMCASLFINGWSFQVFLTSHQDDFEPR